MKTAGSILTSFQTGVECPSTAPRSKDVVSVKEVIYLSLRADAMGVLSALRKLAPEEETNLDGLLWKWASEMACE